MAHEADDEQVDIELLEKARSASRRRCLNGAHGWFAHDAAAATSTWW